MTGIRADANDCIAAGHMMRCITIAQRLKARGEEVLFFVADDYAVPMLERATMQYHCLHTEWNRMCEETDLLLKELERTGCTRILVDSYEATAEYLAVLKEKCKVIYIDDLFEQVYPADVIINYNAYHVRFPYQKSYAGAAKLLLGTAYVPVREEFTAAEHAGDGRNILLSAGGADTCNALTGILHQAEAAGVLNQYIFHVVVGRFNNNRKELEKLAAANDHIILHFDVQRMSELMGNCQAAVSAAGTVLFELCVMQVPAVFYVCADNQQYDAEFFGQNDRMLYAGDMRTSRENCFCQIMVMLEELMNNQTMRETMKRKLQEVTDGYGADRIAESILESNS